MDSTVFTHQGRIEMRVGCFEEQRMLSGSTGHQDGGQRATQGWGIGGFGMGDTSLAMTLEVSG